MHAKTKENNNTSFNISFTGIKQKNIIDENNNEIFGKHKNEKRTNKQTRLKHVKIGK